MWRVVIPVPPPKQAPLYQRTPGQLLAVRIPPLSPAMQHTVSIPGLPPTCSPARYSGMAVTLSHLAARTAAGPRVQTCAAGLMRLCTCGHTSDTMATAWVPPLSLGHTGIGSSCSPLSCNLAYSMPGGHPRSEPAGLRAFAYLLYRNVERSQSS